jgi:type 1 glutamine amidotransferase
MKSVLFVHGGWEGHEPAQCTTVFAKLMRDENYHVEISATLDIFDNAQLLNKTDLIVPAWTMGKLTDTQQKNLCDAVKSGVGIAGWHGGMCDAFRDSTEYQFMTGGQFVAHPGNILDYHVKITSPNDPIMAGISDFKIRSEQYYLHVDPSNEVLAETVFGKQVHDWIQGCVMPVVWKRKYGKGRVFYCALGHVAKEFEKYPQVKEIIKRGMLWASR